MKNQKGFVIVPVLLAITLVGALVSGLVVVKPPHTVTFHKEVLKQGVPGGPYNK